MIKVLTGVIAALLMSSVTALAVEVDERDGDPATSLTQFGDMSVTTEAEVMERPPDTPGVLLDPEIADRLQPPRPEFTFPDLDAERPTAPAMPEPREEPIRPPAFDYQPPAQPSEPKRGPGRDCGTPSGPEGRGAERSAKAGNGTITLSIDPCHSFEWERVDHRVAFNVPGAAVEKVVFDYGDGEVTDVVQHPCNMDTGGRQEVIAGMPHRYEAAGRYTLTARVTWMDCGSNQSQTTSISIPVFRD